jgi:hypothetical protein
MDGLTQRLTLEKIRHLVRDSARRRSRDASRANLLGQAHLDQVTGPTALQSSKRKDREKILRIPKDSRKMYTPVHLSPRIPFGQSI